MALDRRGFIALAAGGVAGSLLTPMVWQSLDDVSKWTQQWPWLPSLDHGEFKDVFTISKMDPCAPGIRVRMVGGRPVNAFGNPEHPLSQGGASAIGVSEVYMRYAPSRVTKPMARKGDKLAPVSWDEALGLVAEKLKGAAGNVAVVSGDETGTVNEVLSAFLGKTGGKSYYLMPSDSLASTKAFGLMGGVGKPGYDINNADFVLFLGADGFESFGASLAARKAFSAKTPTDARSKADYVYAGPAKNFTATVCGKWLPVAADGLTALAMGICYNLLLAGKSFPAADADAFAKLVKEKYNPARIEALTGLGESAVAELSQALLKSKAPLVIPGSPLGCGMSARAFMAAMAVNMLLGRMNVPGGVYAVPELPQVVAGALAKDKMAAADLPSFLKDVAGGKAKMPAVTLFYDANPVYALPESDTVAKAMASGGFKVSFASFMDETSAQSDVVLPLPLSIERHDDAGNPFGAPFALYAKSKPLDKALGEARSATPVLIELAKKMGFDLGFSSFEALQKAKCDALAKAGGFVAKGDNPWKVLAGDMAAPAASSSADLWKALDAGKAWVMTGGVKQGQLLFGAAFLAAEAPKAELSPKQVKLAAMTGSRLGTPSTGIPSHNLITARDTELVENESFVIMNAATAKRLQVAKADLVKVSGSAGSMKVRVHVAEFVATGNVAVIPNLGHSAFDEFSKGKGGNANAVMTAVVEPESKMSTWAASVVTVEKA